MQVHQRSELKLCMNGEHSSFFNFFFFNFRNYLSYFFYSKLNIKKQENSRLNRQKLTIVPI